MPGKSEQSKKRKTSVKVRDMRAKQNPKAGKKHRGKGKADFHEIPITHRIDKASPVLLGP